MLRWLLFPLALVYGFVVVIRNWLFDQGYLTVHKVNSPVLCIGNLTAGGTGKTPWTALIAEKLIAKGKSVAILSRGYKGNFEGVLQVTDSVEPYICGDEPFWLFKNTKASVFVGGDRFSTAKQALAQGDYDVLLMDDGYQHRQFHRNKNILIFDSSAQSWRYWLLPMGRMREFMGGARRAQLCILNKMNLASEKSRNQVVKKIKPYFSDNLVVKANYEFDRWFPLYDGIQREMDEKNAAMACGIANPQSFIETIEKSGVSLTDRFLFPDHYSWPVREIERICHLLKQQGVKDLLITEKDAIKLSRYRSYFLQVDIQLWVCKMKIDILAGENQLESLLDDLIKGEG